MQNTFSERRQFGRRTTRIHAWIALPGRPRQACIVKNLSPCGALIELLEDGLLPFKFPLVMGAPEEVVICQACHQDRNLIGVQFKRRRAATVHAT